MVWSNSFHSDFSTYARGASGKTWRNRVQVTGDVELIAFRTLEVDGIYLLSVI